ncbi:MAG: KH domain-containing protein [Candidatus Micrarchaeota archaeon]|nr:KH domain-containing protein [Candidatus Micrarchaeota archaeon]
MKTPVCAQDVKNGQLCPSCSQKLQTGKISQLDFEVAQILYKINEKHNISNASFTKALDLGRVVLILTEGEVGLLIGKDGKVVGELSAALGKKVRIAQAQSDKKKTVADLIAPARLLGINKVFCQGKEYTKVRIAKKDFAKVPIDLQTLERVLPQLLEEEAKIVFE